MLYQRFNYHLGENTVNPQDRTYDSFTGLRDKNYLLAYLRVAMEEASRENKELSIAMFDMDDFKSVNELLGYETGDIFIKEISQAISKIAKVYDVDVYRFGGEEFVLIFQDQPDTLKQKIAREIVQMVRTNQVIQSYRDIYLRNAQRRLDKYIYSTAKMQRIVALKTKQETIKEVLQSLSTQEAKNDPYFSAKQDEIDRQITTSYLKLIDDRLHKEKDDNIKAVLENAKSKLHAQVKLSDSEYSVLDEYFYSVYDKAHEIYQTKKWINDYMQNDGFGITCGVVNLEPESLEYNTPMDIIDKAGKVLKKGKNTKKAQVYTETISM